jgi:hypothetical protein
MSFTATAQRLIDSARNHRRSPTSDQYWFPVHLTNNLP